MGHGVENDAISKMKSKFTGQNALFAYTKSHEIFQYTNTRHQLLTENKILFVYDNGRYIPYDPAITIQQQAKDLYMKNIKGEYIDLKIKTVRHGLGESIRGNGVDGLKLYKFIVDETPGNFGVTQGQPVNPAPAAGRVRVSILDANPTILERFLTLKVSDHRTTDTNRFIDPGID